VGREIELILGTKARYAVMAMVELARRDSGNPVSLAELASSQEITVPYLEQLFARLRKAGLVSSARGVNGGYNLAMDASNISIFSIVEAADESLQMTRCEPNSEAGCMSGKARCLTHDLWDGLGKQIECYLSGISLADIVNKKR